MQKESKIVFNEKILNKVVSYFGLDAESIKPIGGFESFIYKGKYKEDDIVLRITHSLHRTENEINAEIDFVSFLYDKGLSVPRAYKSLKGRTVEIIEAEDGTYFLATVISYLSGRHVRKDERDAVIFHNLGKILGKMHRETKNFAFSNPNYTRKNWDEEFMELLQFLPKEQTTVAKRIDELLAELHSLPKDKDSFGLIHTDAHFGNMFVDEGNVHIFDFDDSAYKWFVSDIAIVVFYEALMDYDGKSKNDVTELIMTNLMSGYRQENQLDNFWLSKIPLFLKLREITLYLVINRSFDVDNLDNPWCENFMKKRRKRIEESTPFLDYDFTKHCKD